MYLCGQFCGRLRFLECGSQSRDFECDFGGGVAALRVTDGRVDMSGINVLCVLCFVPYGCALMFDIMKREGNVEN